MPRTIADLPNELLERIFMAGLEAPCTSFTHVQNPFGARHGGHAFPTVLSHVCGQWRDVALRLDALWRQIFVDEDASLARVHAFRTRARSQALDLALCFSGAGPLHQGEDIFRYLERADRFLSVMTFSALPTLAWSSLHSLYFRATHHGQAWTLLSQHLRATGMPNLTSLVVDIQHLSGAPSAEIHSEVFDLTNTLGGVEPAPTFNGITPLLDTVALSNIPRYWYPLLLYANDHVRSIELHLWRSDPRDHALRFLTRLASCTTLERLSVSTGWAVLTDWHVPAAVEGPVVFPLLERLELTGPAPAKLLPYIAAPALTRLDICDTQLNEPFSLFVRRAEVPTSFPALRVLVLRDTHVSLRAGTLAHVLGGTVFPALRALVLAGASPDSGLVEELHLVPLPRLETLALLRLSDLFPAWHVRPLRDMLRARRTGGRAVRRLVLEGATWRIWEEEERAMCAGVRALVGELHLLEGPCERWLDSLEYDGHS